MNAAQDKNNQGPANADHERATISVVGDSSASMPPRHVADVNLSRGDKLVIELSKEPTQNREGPPAIDNAGAEPSKGPTAPPSDSAPANEDDKAGNEEASTGESTSSALVEPKHDASGHSATEHDAATAGTQDAPAEQPSPTPSSTTSPTTPSPTSSPSSSTGPSGSDFTALPVGGSILLATGLSLTRNAETYTIEFKGAGSPAPTITVTLADQKKFEKIATWDFSGFEAARPLENTNFAKLLNMGTAEIVIRNLDLVAYKEKALALNADKVSIFVNSPLDGVALKFKSNDYKIVGPDTTGSNARVQASSVEVQAKYPSKEVLGKISNIDFSADTILSGNFGNVTICKDSSFKCSAPDADFREAKWLGLSEDPADITEFQKRNFGFVFCNVLASPLLLKTAELITVETFEKHVEKEFVPVATATKAVKPARKTLESDNIRDLLAEKDKLIPKTITNGGEPPKVPTNPAPTPELSATLSRVSKPEDTIPGGGPKPEDAAAAALSKPGPLPGSEGSPPIPPTVDEPISKDESPADGSDSTPHKRRWGRWVALAAVATIVGGSIWALLGGPNKKTDDLADKNESPDKSSLVTTDESDKTEDNASAPVVTAAETQPTASTDSTTTTNPEAPITTSTFSETPATSTFDVPTVVVAPEQVDLSNATGPSNASVFVDQALLNTIGVPEVESAPNCKSDNNAIDFVAPALRNTVPN